MTDVDALIAQAEPGDGVVVRLPGMLAVIDARRAAADQIAGLLEALRVVSRTAGATSGAPLARQLSIWLSRAEAAPAFGTVAATQDGLAVFLHGDVHLTRGADQPAIRGTEASFAVDRVLPWPTDALRLTIGEPEHRDATRLELPGWAGLESGVAWGAGLTIRPPKADDGATAEPLATAGDAAAILEPAAPAEPLMPPTAPTAPEPPRLTAPALSERIHGAPADQPRAPLPVAGRERPTSQRERHAEAVANAEQRPGAYVRGFRCSRGHLNDPRVAFCGVCGIRMDQVTGILTYERRPPLGLLVLDVGSTFVIDDNYIVGRIPEGAPAVRDGTHRPIRLDDRSGGLSRAHCEIRLEEWDVLLLDLGSANGTYVAGPSAGDRPLWTRLTPGQPFVLTPGTQVVVGRRGFTFESASARL